MRTNKINSCFKSLALCSVLFAELLAGALCTVHADASDLWDGSTNVSWYNSAEDEFVLATAEQFAGFAELVNGGTTFQGMTVKLGADIILNSGSVEKNGTVYSFLSDSDEALREWTPIGVYEGSSSRGFRGIFDGNNHVISGVYMDSNEDYQGLFGISYGCSVKNVRLENSLYISDKATSVGGIIAGTPKNVGPNVTIILDNCMADIVITDNGQLAGNIVAGGIVGSGRAAITSRNTKIDITNSCFNGTIDYSGRGYISNVGGIIGEAGRSGEISQCINEGNITANNSAAGICDYSRDATVISGCYNSGSVTSGRLAGGIIGDSNSALRVERCYNRGKVSGTEGGGGIAPYNAKAGSYINNYYIFSSAEYGIKTDEGKIVNEEEVIECISESELKSAAVLNALNSGGEIYIIPEEGYNDGYPTLKSVYYAKLYGGKYNVNDLKINGTTNVGDVLRMEYAADGEQAALDKIKFGWQLSDTLDGKYSVINSDVNTLTVKAEYHKKYIKAILYLPAGEVLESDPILINIYNSEFDGSIENLEIRGIFKAGNYLYFRYNSENVTDEHIAEVHWYVSGSENGTYSEAGKGSSVKTVDTTSAKYYKVVVTLVNGDEYTSPAVKIEARDAKQWPNYSSESFSDYRADNNSDYVFTVDGHDFILLDTIQTSDTARFKVLAKDTYGKFVLANMDDESFTSQLPELIVKHADRNVFWSGSINAYGYYTFGGKLEAENKLDSNHGFHAPGMEDIIQYKDIIGLKAYNHNASVNSGAGEPVIYGLRTNSSEAENAGYNYAIGADAEGKAVLKKDSNNDFGEGYGTFYEVRPMFYLSRDFFTEAGLDSGLMGAKVIEMIRNSYDKEELANTYNKRILEKEFGYPCDYTITNAKCTQSGANVLIEADVEAYADKKNGVLIAAAYHEDGRMLKVCFGKITIGRGESCKVSFMLENFAATDAESIKISIIGGNDGLVAVTKQIEPGE